MQEALSNVFRHSKASKVTVILGIKNSQLRLKVIDNGKGFKMDQVKASSYGLNSMKERASEIGGVAEVISVEGKGTQIEVKVPIFPEEKERTNVIRVLLIDDHEMVRMGLAAFWRRSPILKSSAKHRTAAKVFGLLWNCRLMSF